MQYLLIDTDVYIQCALLENEGDDKKAIETLLELLDKDKIKLLLPEVVKLEFNNVLKKKLSSLKRAIGIIGEENIKKNNNFDNKVKEDIREALDGVIKKREKNIDEVKVLLNKIFTHKNTIFLKLTNDSVLNAYKMYLAGEKPYSPDPIKGSIQTDCLIIDVVREFLKEEKDYELYICSRNKSDFSENPDNKEKKYTIARDVREKFSKVEYTPNLFQLLNDKFGSKFGEKLVKKVSKEISENKLNYQPFIVTGIPYGSLTSGASVIGPATISHVPSGTPLVLGTPPIGTVTVVEPISTNIEQVGTSFPLAFGDFSNQKCVECGNARDMEYYLLCKECRQKRGISW